ncbi:uncharacterized protein LOC113978681 [Neopelma chrysocephalum]|uniref:uncharacterized protein LOC113978681 n=1 Tax=Neopelma chrysocephalum TaxID=114329 RepID=UPI000FCD3265|nr:uncharacterized protein LOC113978681 [Neopelma chrysocephalum]
MIPHSVPGQGCERSGKPFAGSMGICVLCKTRTALFPWHRLSSGLLGAGNGVVWSWEWDGLELGMGWSEGSTDQKLLSVWKGELPNSRKISPQNITRCQPFPWKSQGTSGNAASPHLGFTPVAPWPGMLMEFQSGLRKLLVNSWGRNFESFRGIEASARVSSAAKSRIWFVSRSGMLWSCRVWNAALAGAGDPLAIAPSPKSSLLCSSPPECAQQRELQPRQPLHPGFSLGSGWMPGVLTHPARSALGRGIGKFRIHLELSVLRLSGCPCAVRIEAAGPWDGVRYNTRCRRPPGLNPGISLGSIGISAVHQQAMGGHLLHTTGSLLVAQVWSRAELGGKSQP